MKILIVAALPQEYSPLKKLLPYRRLPGRKPFKKFAFNLPDKEIVLVECGMGSQSAEELLQMEIPGFKPDLMVFAGFAGGLHPDLGVGEVCFTVCVRETESDDLVYFRFPGELNVFLKQHHAVPVMGISACTPGDKHDLCSLASGQKAVLDMETAKVAEIAMRNNVPFICFRAISDCLDHDLGFNLNDVADGNGRVRIVRIILALLARPAVAKALFLAWRRSRLAAKNLCGSVAAFLGIPALSLNKMAGEMRIERS